eukprot:gene5886-biopygen4888
MARRDDNEAEAVEQIRPVPAPRPRKTIVDIRPFAGKDSEDITEWLVNWEVAFAANGWTEEQQVQLIPAYLAGRAARTFWRMSARERQDLDALKEALDDTFNTEEKRYLARQKLQEITQGSKETVVEFSERVDQLVTRGHDGLDSPGRRDRIACECFVKGLRAEIKETVWEKCPATFQEAVTAAERREVFLNTMGRRSRVNTVTDDVMATIQKFNDERARSNEAIWKAIDSLTAAVQNLTAQTAQISLGQEIASSAACLIGAGGERLPVVGEGRICLQIKGLRFDLPVIIVDDFKFDLLLGDEFLRSEGVIIDYGVRRLKLCGLDVSFESLPSDCVAVLKSVVTLPAGKPVRIRAELVGNHCGLALFGERQLVKTDERVLVAPIVTKADSDNFVWVEVANTTCSTVSLQPGTKLMHLQPFLSDVNTVRAEQIAEDVTEVPIEEMKISHLSEEQKSSLLSVFKKHDVWPKSGRLATTPLVEHPVDVQGAEPVRQRPYRVPETKRNMIANEVQKMLLSDVIQPSASPWCSPVILLEKPNGEYRFCVDYRRLNEVTKKDAYPLPRIDETLDALGNATWFSTLDLQSGFWQIPTRESDIEKTAFMTHHGHWEFRVMPFGMANAPATFQRLMDLVLSGLHWTHCLVYLDDIVVFAATEEEHMRRLDLVLERIAKAGLTVKPSKCQWLQRQVKFLGHIVFSEGVAVDPAKVKAVKSFPTPKNQTDVRSFIGLTSYYRRFIPEYASRTKALTELTKKKCKFSGSEEAEKSFEDLKNCLSTAPVLRCPDFNLQFKLYTDACDYGIGAVLAQETANGEVVVAYASRLLKSSEKKYAVLQKEALGIVWSLKHFYPYLYGRRFTVVTDHRPLKWLKTMTAPNNLFARWISEIQAYDFDVFHRPGRLHSNADTLSRYPVAEDSVMTVGEHEFLKAQIEDDYAGAWIEFLSKGKEPENQELAEKLKREKDRYAIAEDGCVYRKCDTRNGSVKKQFLVPKSRVGQLLTKYHDNPLSAHPGFYRCYRKIQMAYYWPTMKTDIKRHIRHCQECAKYKSTKPACKTPLKSITTERPMQIVAMDFVGPLPKSDRGNLYALVMTDHFTRWPIVYPTENLEAETVARKLAEFIHIYGCPEQLLSDRGSNFTSALIKALCKQLGVKKIFTCAFRPSSNGLNEHLNGTLFNAVKMYASKKPSVWDEYLDAVKFAYRTTPHSVTQHTPAFLMFGREVNSPLDMKPPTRLYSDEYLKVMQNERQQAYSLVKELVAKEQQRQKTHHDKNIKQLNVKVGEKVWIRDFIVKKGTSKKFHQPWVGPYEVSKVVGKNNVEIIIPGKRNNKTKRVNMEQVKLAKEIDGKPEDVIKIHDKLRTRLPGQRLVTRYFVEFHDGHTQWIDPEFVPDNLLEDFNACK